MIRNTTNIYTLINLLAWASIVLVIFVTVSKRVAAQSGTTLRIDPMSTSLAVDETLDFSIVIDVADGQNYGFGSYTLEYDSNVLELSDFTTGPSLTGAINLNDLGVIRFNAIAPTGATGTVVLASGQFTAIGEGDFDLTIDIVDQPGDSTGATLPDLISVGSSVSVAAAPEVSGNPNQLLFLPIILND